MNSKTLNNLLIKTFAVQIPFSDENLARWDLELGGLTDEEGEAAIMALKRENPRQMLNPTQVLNRAREQKQFKKDLESYQQRTQGDGGKPWISTAPRFKGDASQVNPSPEYLAWLSSERQKLYRSVDSNGDIFWIQNPAAWAWEISPEGKLTFIKPKPIETGEKLQKKKAAGPKWSY